MIFKIADGRECFYQWDIDRQLIVDDPTITEVHFCNRTDVCSLVVEVVDGVASVPNKVLQSGFDVRVFGYDGKATLHEATFEVKARTQPTDYVYTEVEIKRYSDLEKRIDEIENATEGAIGDAVRDYLDEHPITMDGYATEEYVNEAVSNIEIPEVDFTGYATEDYVDEAVKNVKVDVNLDDYAKKTDIPDVSDFITSIPSEYVTETELEAKGYAKASALNDKANTNHTHTEYAKTNHTHSTADVDGLQKALNEKVTQADIDKAIELHDHRYDYAPIEHSHGDEYAAKTHTHSYNNLLDKPTIPSVEGLATETYVDDAIAQAQLGGEDVDLSEYAKKSELFSKDYNDLTNKPTIPSIDGLATEEYVNNAVANIEIPEDTEILDVTLSTATPGAFLSAEDSAKLIANPDKYIIRVTYNYFASGVNVLFNKVCFKFSHISDLTSNLHYSAVHNSDTDNNSTIVSSLLVTSDVTGAFVSLKSTVLKQGQTIDIDNYYTKAEVDEALANAGGSGGGSAEGAVSYAVEQELTDEQKNLAKANIGAPYISTEMSNLEEDFKQRKFTHDTSSGEMSMWANSSTSLKLITDAGAGTRFTITVEDALENPTFSETIMCRYAPTSSTSHRYEVLSDTTDYVFFNNPGSTVYFSTSQMYYPKKDTSAAGLAGTLYLTILYEASVFNNKLSPKHIDSDIFSKGHVAFDSSDCTVWLQEIDSNYALKTNNTVIGRDNRLYSSGSYVFGKFNYLNSQTIESLVVGRDNNLAADGATTVNVLGSYNQCTSNRVYGLIAGQYSHKCNRYALYSSFTTYNAGDIACRYSSSQLYLYRCLADGTSNKNIPSGTNSNDYWEYVSHGQSAMNLLTLGNGTSSGKSNAFEVDYAGNVTAAGTVTPTGADYAEYFEFEDGNPTREDRIGYLVELSGAKIRLANGTDILGAVSSTMGVIGDAEEMNWHGKYERDEFGRPVFEEVEVTEKEINEAGEEVEVTNLIMTKKLNKDYNPDRPYTPRSMRKEWAPVGLLGKVFVRHDGTLVAGDYVKAINGIASKSDERTNIRVLEVISDNVIKVLIK